MVVRQEVPRGVRRSGELLSQRAPVEHDSAHAHEDADLVSKVAPLPHKYNYRTPCFRDLQTQNAYLRGQVAKLSAETRDEASELEYYKGQVHELTVHRAVLHKENERLLAERRAVEEAAARNAASHDRHLELAQSATRLRTQLEDSLALNDSLRDELRAAALARAADGVRAQALERELGTMEAELRAATARGRALRDEAASSAHQLRQAHLLLSKTQDVRAARRLVEPRHGRARAAHAAPAPAAPRRAAPRVAQSHSNARSKLDELSAQHESMKATFRAQAALTESLDQQLRRARDDARGNATGHENTAHDLTREREAHVGTRQALAAAQLEVERLQQKLDWCARRASPAAPPGLVEPPPRSARCALSDSGGFRQRFRRPWRAGWPRSTARRSWAGARLRSSCATRTSRSRRYRRACPSIRSGSGWAGRTRSRCGNGPSTTRGCAST